MKIELAEILVCDCSSREHQIVIEHDREDNIVYCHIHLVKFGFFSRLKSGLRYIFGYKCKYGNWDEFIFKEEHADKLIEIGKILKNKNKKL